MIRTIVSTRITFASVSNSPRSGEGLRLAAYARCGEGGPNYAGLTEPGNDIEPV